MFRVIQFVMILMRLTAWPVKFAKLFFIQKRVRHFADAVLMVVAPSIVQLRAGNPALGHEAPDENSAIFIKRFASR